MTIFNPFRRRKAEPSKPEHVHSWKPIAVNQGVMGGFAAEDGNPLKATEILQECGCGDFRSQAVWGTWSLEDVKAGELSKDVLELRRMASL